LETKLETNVLAHGVSSMGWRMVWRMYCIPSIDPQVSLLFLLSATNETKCHSVTQPASQPYRYSASLPTLPLPSQPANLTVTQPASQPYRYPAIQPATPLPSQPASLSVTQPATHLYQPASPPNTQTHTPPPCLPGLLVYRGELFPTLTCHQNWGGNGLIQSECFESAFCFRTV
jgi:hypothetical protein